MAPHILGQGINTVLFTIRDLVVLFSGFLGLILATSLFYTKSNNQRSNRLLASFLILQALALLVTVLFYRHHFAKSEWLNLNLYRLESSLLLLEGFCLYWYCKELLFNESQSTKFIFSHLSPLFVLFMGASYLYTGKDIQGYIFLDTENRSPVIGFTYLTMQLVRFGYVVMCFNLMRRYKRRMEQRYSNTCKQDFSWLAWLLMAFLLIRGAWLLLNFHSALSTLAFWEFYWMPLIVKIIYPALDLSWFVVHLALLFFGLNYSSNFEGLSNESNSKASPKLPTNYLPLVKRLESHMAAQRRHIDPDLKLETLASEVSIPAKTLSTIINQHFKTNFCGFVNQYRIREAAQELSQVNEPSRSVIDIAYSVGFSSKSTFNRAFKLQMGCTPLHYRKRQ